MVDPGFLATLGGILALVGGTMGSVIGITKAARKLRSNLAAFCTFRMDPRSRLTELEPLATMPDHRKKGVAKAMLLEGIDRLYKYKPTLIYIGGAANTPGANALYESTGFIEKIAEHRWRRNI